MIIDPKTIPVSKLQGYLQGTVSPRPIAFVSSIDKDGMVNLSPFSFFNLFSMNPPVLVFSPSRRVRDNTTKHTLQNVLEVPEVVINIVNYSMVQQTSLASVEFPKGVNEFHKAGFTEAPSLKVKPPRVSESPASFECKVNQVISLGSEGGAGNLVVCEILLAHIKDEIFDESGKIDPNKVDAVARMGGDYYCRAHGENVFMVPKPTDRVSIGVDQIPSAIRNSTVLTRNDLGILGSTLSLPDDQTIKLFKASPEYQALAERDEASIHTLAKQYLREGRVEEAWKILLATV
jgi:flavin reductase (DIM6/NTAB) family NADH-FMN oxidoreductase RutF